MNPDLSVGCLWQDDQEGVACKVLGAQERVWAEGIYLEGVGQSL